jgi:hypothetical protein
MRSERGALLGTRGRFWTEFREGQRRQAIAYVASTDRAWPFSFENRCDALGLDAPALREELMVVDGVV